MKSIKFRSGVFKSIGTMMLVVLVLGGCAGQSGYQSQVQPQPVSPEPSQATTPSQPASISTVEVEEQDNSVRVVIKGSEPLTYTVLQKEAPLRLVVDVAGAKLNAPPETLKVEKGAITEIWPSEVDNNGEPATRIEIGLNTASANYEVLPSGNDLFIDFPTPTQTEPVKKAEGIVDVAISDAGSFVQVDIMADGKIEDYKVFALKEPARLVVDLPGLMSFLPYKTQDFPSPLLNKIRYGEHQD
ncbi:MAG: AMIN domain-containing protein, partial [Pseudomonadota bacterium]